MKEFSPASGKLNILGSDSTFSIQSINESVIQGNKDNTKCEVDIRQQHDRNSRKICCKLKVSCKILH